MLLVKIILCSKFPWTKFIDCKCFDVISVVGGCRDLENAARKFCSERVRVDMSAGEVTPQIPSGRNRSTWSMNDLI